MCIEPHDLTPRFGHNKCRRKGQCLRSRMLHFRINTIAVKQMTTALLTLHFENVAKSCRGPQQVVGCLNNK